MYSNHSRFIALLVFALALPVSAQDTIIQVKIPSPTVAIQFDHDTLNTDFYQVVVDGPTGTVCALDVTKSAAPDANGLYTFTAPFPDCLNLLKGTHTIQVEAANNDGGLSTPSDPITLKITVNPNKPGKPKIVIQ